MPLKPRKDLGFAANFLYMLNGVEPSEIEVEAMNKALILHADHELNASTFAARVCASTLTDIYSCVTTAIGALKGPLHGGANERVFDMLKESVNLVMLMLTCRKNLILKKKSWDLDTVYTRNRILVKFS